MRTAGTIRAKASHAFWTQPMARARVVHDRPPVEQVFAADGYSDRCTACSLSSPED